MHTITGKYLNGKKFKYKNIEIANIRGNEKEVHLTIVEKQSFLHPNNTVRLNVKSDLICKSIEIT